MAEPVTVVALVHPVPGKARECAEAFRGIAQDVHDEPGCELYAVHIAQDESLVVMIERWSSQEELQAHIDGPTLKKLAVLSEGLRSAPSDVIRLTPVPMGDPAKGVVG